MSPLLSLVSLSGILDLAFKSAAVILTALVVAALLRRASAAWRHLVWCLSVVSLLLLPALVLALPAWQVTWLPQWADEPSPLATAHSAVVHADRIQPLDAEEPTLLNLPPSAESAPTKARHPLLAKATKMIGEEPAPIPWLGIGWAAGMLLSLVPLAVGLWQLAALHRRSKVIDDQHWVTLVDELRRQLNVRRSV